MLRHNMEVAGFGLPTKRFAQEVEIPEPRTYDGESEDPWRFFMGCQIYWQSLREPKPAPECWVRCMMRWLTGSARQFALHLSRTEHPCIYNTEDFKKELEKFHAQIKLGVSPELVWGGAGDMNRGSGQAEEAVCIPEPPKPVRSEGSFLERESGNASSLSLDMGVLCFDPPEQRTMDYASAEIVTLPMCHDEGSSGASAKTTKAAK